MNFYYIYFLLRFFFYFYILESPLQPLAWLVGVFLHQIFFYWYFSSSSVCFANLFQITEMPTPLPILNCVRYFVAVEWNICILHWNYFQQFEELNKDIQDVFKIKLQTSTTCCTHQNKLQSFYEHGHQKIFCNKKHFVRKDSCSSPFQTNLIWILWPIEKKYILIWKK